MKDDDTNSQMIQQKLIRNKYILRFLKDNSSETYNEIINQYHAIIGKMYLKTFKAYLTGLLKYKDDDSTKYDIVAVYLYYK